MDERTEKPPASLVVVLVVATLQGLLLWWADEGIDFRRVPQNDHAWHTTLFSFGIFIGPLIYVLMPYLGRRTAQVALGMGAVWLLGSGWQLSSHFAAPGAPPSFEPIPFELLFLQFLILFHAVPFLQGYLRERRFASSYRVLFFDTWNNALQLVTAALFTGIFWLLLWLCSELFEMIGLRFLRVVLFDNTGFGWIVTALAFGVGFRLVGSAERLLAALRQQVLGLLKWLVPVATVIMVAFSLALVIRAPTLIMEHAHVIRAVWLLWLVIVSVYLYNAAYQDGSIDAPYPATLGRLIRWVTPLLGLLAGIALYDVLVRIHANGLTNSRYWGLIVGLTTFAYALGYGFASVRRGAWLGLMGRVNVFVALGVIALLTLSLTPLLSPQRLAAVSQASRLKHGVGVAGPEDFMALRFDEGTYGYAELKELAASQDIEVSIQAGAKAAVGVRDWEGRNHFAYTTVTAPAMVFEAFPQDAIIDADLKEKMLGDMPKPHRGAVGVALVGVGISGAHKGEKLLCSTDLPCPVLFADLRGDGEQEAVLLVGYQTIVFGKGVGGWRELGRPLWRSRRNMSGEAMLRALRAGDYHVVEPYWKSLQIGGSALRLDLPEGP